MVQAADLGASAPDGYITYGGGLMLKLIRIKLMDIFLYQKLQIEKIILKLQFQVV